MSEKHWQNKPDLPAVYEVSIRGKLNANWSDWLDQVTITTRSHEDGQSVTILTGCIKDQAALYGLIAKIKNLGLTILSINQVETEKSCKSDCNDN